MTRHPLRQTCLVAGLLAGLAAPLPARTPDQRGPDPVVTGAPFIADSVITVTLTTFGEKVEQRVVARIYRDSAGRIRREQVAGASETPTPADRDDLIVIIVDPLASVVYSLNPASRTAYRMPMGERTTAAAAIPQPSSALTEPLGTRQVEGITVSGSRGVTLLPAGADGRPVEIADERWESADLRIALIERHRDSRSGVFEHRLLNVRRTEPAAELFVVPASYTIVDVPAAASR
jgi:hypothetical protein